MSLARLNHLLMLDILPFNFGMTYQDWICFYDSFHNTSLSELCPKQDPRTWTQEQIDMTNNIAKEENDLYARLMALPQEEFYEEAKRLAPK